MGRQLAGRDPLLALPYLHLRNACEPGSSGILLAPEFQRECFRLTMLAAFPGRDLQSSHVTATALRVAAPDEAERLRAADFLARIEWRRSKQ